VRACAFSGDSLLSIRMLPRAFGPRGRLRLLMPRLWSGCWFGLLHQASKEQDDPHGLLRRPCLHKSVETLDEDVMPHRMPSFQLNQLGIMRQIGFSVKNGVSGRKRRTPPRAGPWRGSCLPFHAAAVKMAVAECVALSRLRCASLEYVARHGDSLRGANALQSHLCVRAMQSIFVQSLLLNYAR